jgi:hypothetical protein
VVLKLACNLHIISVSFIWRRQKWIYKPLILAIILSSSISVYPALEFVKLYKWLCLTSEELGQRMCTRTEYYLQLCVKNSSLFSGPKSDTAKIFQHPSRCRISLIRHLHESCQHKKCRFTEPVKSRPLSTTSWKRMREWMYRSTFSWRRH